MLPPGVENILPEVYNVEDPVTGFQGVPPDMTLVSELMKKGGYVTRFVGKYDIGMATSRHHPKARGFDSWLGYWHHANDYWQQNTETCPNVTLEGVAVSSNIPIKDLWRYDDGFDGPATDLANDPRCSQFRQSGFGNFSCEFEELILVNEAAGIIRSHQGSPMNGSHSPLFMVYAMHLVHYPLQAPQSYVDAFASVDDVERRHMAAMVSLTDDAVGAVVEAIKEPKDDDFAVTWNNTLVVVHSDNGYAVCVSSSSSFPH